MSQTDLGIDPEMTIIWCTGLIRRMVVIEEDKCMGEVE